MKKKICLLVVLMLMIVMPFAVSAKEKPNIYMFRGKGCGYCRAFINFMDSIKKEYGKYYNFVSFEVWYDSANSELLSTTSEFLNQPASGVPYIIIGDQVFAGYSADYDEGIKKAIKELYETNENERYDVFAEMKKKDKEVDLEKYTSLTFKETLKDEEDASKESSDNNANSSGNEETSNYSASNSNTTVIIWNLVFTIVATASIMGFMQYKFSILRKKMKK